MFSKNELKLTYAVAAILLVIGAVSYAAFPLQEPEEPLRLRFTVAAANVLFDHKAHASESGYGLSCEDCHHELLDGEYDAPNSCTECHDPDEGDEDMPKRADAFHQQCAGCHEEFEAGPTESECALCHVL